MKYVVAAILFFMLPVSSSAGYEEGKRALDIKDYQSAVREFRKAAENGDAKAQFHLGRLYERGLGVNRSYVDAVYWYTRSDANDTNRRSLLAYGGRSEGQSALFSLYDNLDANTLFEIGFAFANGGGMLERNDDQAIYWLQKAADRGHVRAGAELGAVSTRSREAANIERGKLLIGQ